VEVGGGVSSIHQQSTALVAELKHRWS